MHRKIILIDKEKCNGCGACAKACHEGAIGMVEGKAQLLREDYCDGLGDCLPACPTGAISFEMREALAYDEAAVKQAKEGLRKLEPEFSLHTEAQEKSCLRNWPVQIKLTPVSSPAFQNRELLVAADCTAYAYAGFHQNFIRGKTVLIGCPKLDQIDYSEKLTKILERSRIESITVARMEVPCCGGLDYAVKKAVRQSGKKLSLRVVTISAEGDILKEERNDM